MKSEHPGLPSARTLVGQYDRSVYPGSPYLCCGLLVIFHPLPPSCSSGMHLHLSTLSLALSPSSPLTVRAYCSAAHTCRDGPQYSLSHHLQQAPRGIFSLIIEKHWKQSTYPLKRLWINHTSYNGLIFSRPWGCPPSDNQTQHKELLPNSALTKNFFPSERC